MIYICHGVNLADILLLQYDQVGFSLTQTSPISMMPVEVLAEIFNSENKAFQKVADNKHNCIVPLKTEGQWVVLFFLGSKKILLVKEYLISSINVSFAGKHITAKSSYNMIPIWVVFDRVFWLMCALNN